MTPGVVCPYCDFKSDKMPTRKRKCPSCGETIFIRKEKKRKILVTEEGAREITGQIYTPMKARAFVSISIIFLLLLSFSGCGNPGNGEAKCSLTVSVIGEGAIMKDPNKTEYLLGDEIKLTAVPETSWEFEHWEERLSGSENPINIIIYDDMSVTAVFNMGMQWSFATGGQVYSSPAIATDGTIYVVSAATLYAINPDGSEKWSFNASASVYSSPAIGADGAIYVGSQNGGLYAINPAGSEKWSFVSRLLGITGIEITSSPAIGADGTIYVGSRDNNLYAINPDGSEKWSFTTGGWVRNSPTIGANGTVYVGSYDGNVYAVNSSSGGPADAGWPMFHQNERHTGLQPTP